MLASAPWGCIKSEVLTGMGAWLCWQGRVDCTDEPLRRCVMPTSL